MTALEDLRALQENWRKLIYHRHCGELLQPIIEKLSKEQVEYVSCKESYPPTGCVVFITDGRDVGIGTYLGNGWKLLSGHSMKPTHWTMIQFPQAKP